MHNCITYLLEPVYVWFSDWLQYLNIFWRITQNHFRRALNPIHLSMRKQSNNCTNHSYPSELLVFKTHRGFLCHHMMLFTSPCKPLPCGTYRVLRPWPESARFKERKHNVKVKCVIFAMQKHRNPLVVWLTEEFNSVVLTKKKLLKLLTLPFRKP